MEFQLKCEKLVDDNFFVYPADEEDGRGCIGMGETELEAWEAAEDTISRRKKDAEKSLSEANMLMHEILDAKRYCY